jgi:hypothetical protein
VWTRISNSDRSQPPGLNYFFQGNRTLGFNFGHFISLILPLDVTSKGSRNSHSSIVRRNVSLLVALDSSYSDLALLQNRSSESHFDQCLSLDGVLSSISRSIDWLWRIVYLRLIAIRLALWTCDSLIYRSTQRVMLPYATMSQKSMTVRSESRVLSGLSPLQFITHEQGIHKWNVNFRPFLLLEDLAFSPHYSNTDESSPFNLVDFSCRWIGS